MGSLADGDNSIIPGSELRAVSIIISKIMSSSELSDLINLGPRSTRWLNNIGIRNLADLENVGAVEAYRQLRELDYPVTLNLVYGIQGAIINCPWNQLPADMVDELRKQVKGSTNPGSRKI